MTESLNKHFHQLREKRLSEGERRLVEECLPPGRLNLMKTLTFVLVGVVIILETGFRFDFGHCGSSDAELSNPNADSDKVRYIISFLVAHNANHNCRSCQVTMISLSKQI